MRLSNRTGGLVFLIGVALLGCDEQAADKATTGAAGSGSGAGSAGGSAGGAGSGGGTGAKGPATTGGAYAKSLAACEPKALRYRFLHVPARLTHSARRRRLRIPESWPWAAAIVAVFANIAAIPQPA